MCDSEDLLRAGRRRGWHEMRNLSAPTLCPFLLVSLWSTVKLLTVMGLCWVTWFLWQTARDMELSFSCSHEERLVASSLPWHRDAYPALLYYWAFWLCAALRSFSSQTQIRISSNQLCPPTNRSFSLACTKAFVCKRNCNLELVFWQHGIFCSIWIQIWQSPFRRTSTKCWLGSSF